MANLPILKKFVEVLIERYGLSRHGNKRRPLDDLVYILLSRQTNERNFVAAYNSLRRKCQSWSDLLSLSEYQILQIIGRAGLGRQRARELKEIARRIQQDFGSVSLKFLSRYTDEAAEAYLTSLPGIGKKSARCILMYSLNRKVFPVDVHCFRILNRLGVIRMHGAVRKHEDSIQRLIPESLRHELHVTLVSLGRDVCHASNPECYRCPLVPYCHFPKKGQIQ